MRVVFLGTPSFAISSLEAVLAACEVSGVVTRPDRPRGRGRREEPPPVAVAAWQYGLEVLQPRSLRDPAFILRIRALAPDLFVAVAYGRLIPEEMLGLAPFRGVNLHPSLLPRYRGPAPIARAVAAGEPETGVSVIYISQEVDAGDIIVQRRCPISVDDTSRTLEARLAREGADLLAEALKLIESGEAPGHRQDASLATWAPKVAREEGLIRWTEPAERIVNLVRAFDPWPVAYTVHDGRPLRIWRAVVAPGAVPAGDAARRPPPGTVLRAEDEEFDVLAGEGAVRIHEVQPASGRRMTSGAYLRGHPLARGVTLGTLGSAPRPEDVS